MPPCFAAAQLTHPGGREYNEDHCLAAAVENAACWVLADGLGGHAGGADASGVVCEAVVSDFRANPAVTREAVQAHIEAAQNALLTKQKEQPELSRMRTTIVVLVANATHAVWSHVGDSRLYHFRRGAAISRTKDHSIPQKLADAGEIAEEQIRHHEDRNRLLRALGEENMGHSRTVPEVVPIYRDDAFLLCTDGFWEHVHELEMEVDYAKSSGPAEWLSYMEDRLQARVNGSHDNYTAIGIIGDGLPAAPPKTIARRTRSRETWQRLLLDLAAFIFFPAILLFSAVQMGAAGQVKRMWEHRGMASQKQLKDGQGIQGASSSKAGSSVQDTRK